MRRSRRALRKFLRNLKGPDFLWETEVEPVREGKRNAMAGRGCGERRMRLMVEARQAAGSPPLRCRSKRLMLQSVSQEESPSEADTEPPALLDTQLITLKKIRPHNWQQQQVKKTPITRSQRFQDLPKRRGERCHRSQEPWHGQCWHQTGALKLACHTLQ